MIIKSRKSNYCLLGNNIQRSRSPRIYEYWFAKYNIAGNYKIENIEIEEFYNKIGKIFELEIFTKLNFKILVSLYGLTSQLLVINCSSLIEYLKQQINYKSYIDINYNFKNALEEKEDFASVMLIYQAQKAFEI